MVFGISSGRWCGVWVLAVVVGVVVVGLCAGRGDAAPPTICMNQQKYPPLSPYGRKLCAVLSNISEFSRAMEDYLDAQVIKNSMPINEPEVKRQDIDHVFLRFGRAQQ